MSHISNEKQNFSSGSDKNEIKCVEAKEVNYLLFINNNYNIFIVIQNYTYSATKANFHL